MFARLFLSKGRIYMISLIVARSRNNVIGNAEGIPWKIKGEQKQFKELTTGNVVIMGRKTFEDMGRPLPNRLNIIVSNTKYFSGKDPQLITVGTLEGALAVAKCAENSEIYIAGGRRLYEEALPLIDRLFVTEVDLTVPEDDTTVYFPQFDCKVYEKLSGPALGTDIKFTRTVYVKPGTDLNGIGTYLNI